MARKASKSLSEAVSAEIKRKFDLNKYSKNYLNHLFNTNEILASMLLTLHNINFYQELMLAIRQHIKKGTFERFHKKYFNKI